VQRKDKQAPTMQATKNILGSPWPQQIAYALLGAHAGCIGWFIS
jgi:hypothetical protein